MKVTFEGGHQGRLPREGGVYPGAVEKKVLIRTDSCPVPTEMCKSCVYVCKWVAHVEDTLGIRWRPSATLT